MEIVESVDLPIVGFRFWNDMRLWIFDHGYDGNLGSLFYDFRWRLRGINNAECRDGLSALRSCANWVSGNCPCGLYVHKRHPYITMGKGISGIVVGFGSVHEHSLGFRAEKAKILALIDVNVHLHGKMSFPVPILQTEQYMTEFARQHGILLDVLEES